MWQVNTWATWSVLPVISFHQPRAFWFNRNYMESPWMSKHIFLPSLKDEPETNTHDVTSNVAVIQSFSITWETQLKWGLCQAQASLSAVRSRASFGIYFGIIWTANELLPVMQLHCDFTGVLWVNLVLTPVAMDVPVCPALLLQKWAADEADRWREAGRGRKKKSLNKERNGPFLKMCATESMCFSANVPLLKSFLPSACFHFLIFIP